MLKCERLWKGQFELVLNKTQLMLYKSFRQTRPFLHETSKNVWNNGIYNIFKCLM